MNVNRFYKQLCKLGTTPLRSEQSGDAHNIRLKEILKRRALFGNQIPQYCGMHQIGSGALMNRQNA